MARNKFGRMPSNMSGMMKQMQKVQSQIENLQKELEEKTLETTAGGGAIKIVVNGKNEVVELKIDKDIVDPDDVEMLEDLIIAGINSAFKDIEKEKNDEMAKLTGGLGIPGL